jgi:hypothetical protein
MVLLEKNEFKDFETGSHRFSVNIEEVLQGINENSREIHQKALARALSMKKREEKGEK